MRVGGLEYREVWAVDFEFAAPPGDVPRPVCLVAWELGTGTKLRIWRDNLLAMARPPYGIAEDCLFIAYYASAEIGCHLALGWPLPTNVLDLFTEFRNLTNGRPVTCGAGLLGALAFFGEDAIGVAEKDAMRDLAQREAPWTRAEQHALLDYCESDVAALARLVPHFQPNLDIRRALFRGRYMVAAARMEHNGVPIDAPTHRRIQQEWGVIQAQLINQVDRQYGVFEGRTFKRSWWERYLAEQGIPWPRLPSGQLALDDDTFREMARADVRVAPMRELRTALAQMRLSDLAVGADDRNRCLLSAFRARTGRNQPSNTRFVFGPAVWLRFLIQPPIGSALAYVDWSQQEFGIAAALSGDARMIQAYQSGDPYLAFARQAGAVPVGATKESHAAVRGQFKACVLAVQYGMGYEALAQRIGQSPAHARELLRLHAATYAQFWRWSNGVVDYAMLHGRLWTVFGWKIHVGANPNERSLRNFPMQANGAEMLRLACCMATEQGIRVCAPVHDAVLIEATNHEIEAVAGQMQEIMREASQVVLDGVCLRSDATITRSPDRYHDPRGTAMWDSVQNILEDLESGILRTGDRVGRASAG